MFPLPKFQFQAVGLPVDWSWKVTISGEQPESGEPVKAATGACPESFKTPEKIIACTAISFVRILLRFSFTRACLKVLSENVMLLAKTIPQSAFLIDYEQFCSELIKDVVRM